MWTGILMIKSQVDAVGLQAQPCGQPCINVMPNIFGNPSGGTSHDPVSHFTKSFSWTLEPSGNM